MTKDFIKWCKRKEALHLTIGGRFFNEREVWWCALGLNIGYEQDGSGEIFERPVLIIKKFNRELLWAIPLTRTTKVSIRYHPITVGDKNSTVILSQLRLISARRLQRYMQKVPNDQFKDIIKGIQRLLPRI